MKRTLIAIVCLLAATSILACGPGIRPNALLKADQQVANKTETQLAAKAAPQIYKLSQRYYGLAEGAYNDGDEDDCIRYATMAAIKFSTALERARHLSADDRRGRAEQLTAAAKKGKAQQNARLADAQKRSQRMEQILALKTKLDSEKKQSRKDKKRIAAELKKAQEEARVKLAAEQKAAAGRLAAEQAKAEQLKKEQALNELLAQASSKIQMAESLDAKKYDPANLNNAKTFLGQAKQAQIDKRHKNALDLAKMAIVKIDLATAAAQAEYAKKRKETERLAERENLFKEANGAGGMLVKTEKRGLVLTMYDMFAPGKSIVLPERTYLLDKIATMAEKYKDYPLVIEGYTDSRGRKTDNLALSQTRAQSVLDYLIQDKKLKFDRIKSSGYGEARPIADNSRAAGRAKNRRIEVIFLYR